MSADDVPHIEITGPHVQIEVVDEYTATLAREYFHTKLGGIEAAESSPDATDADVATAVESGERTVAPDVDEEIVDAVADATGGQDDQDTSAVPEASVTAQDLEDESEPSELSKTPESATVDANLTDLQQEVVDALAAHGEQAAADLKTVTGQDGGVYKRLNALEEQGLIETRPNPDDGRQTLYSLATEGDESASDNADSDDSELEERDDEPEPDESGDEIPQTHPTIEVEDRTKTRTLDANDVVDALQQPTKHRAKAQLGLSLDAFERLLAQLDLAERFDADAPLPAGEVQETVATYLEVDA